MNSVTITNVGGSATTITVNDVVVNTTMHYWMDPVSGAFTVFDGPRSNLFVILNKLNIKGTPVKGMSLYTAVVPTWTTSGTSISIDVPLYDDSSKKKSKGEKRAKRQEWKSIQSRHSRNTGRR